MIRCRLAFRDPRIWIRTRAPSSYPFIFAYATGQVRSEHCFAESLRDVAKRAVRSRCWNAPREIAPPRVSRTLLPQSHFLLFSMFGGRALPRSNELSKKKIALSLQPLHETDPRGVALLPRERHHPSWSEAAMRPPGWQGEFRSGEAAGFRCRRATADLTIQRRRYVSTFLLIPIHLDFVLSRVYFLSRGASRAETRRVESSATPAPRAQRSLIINDPTRRFHMTRPLLHGGNFISPRGERTRW